MKRLALLTVLACATCSGVSPSPRLESVTPGIARSDRPTRLLIAGEGFAPLITVDTGSGRRTVDDSFDVRLGGVALTEVMRVSDTELAATCPAGTPTGTSDLVVTDPRGRIATLPAALTVLDADVTAPRVVFESPAEGPFPPGAIVQVVAFARDPLPGLIGELVIEADAGSPRSEQTLADPPIPEIRYQLSYQMPTDLPEGSVVTLMARARDDAPQPNIGEASLHLTVGPAPPGPQLYSIVPARGTIAGGQAVTIDGMNFTAQTVIELGGLPLQTVTLDGPTRIRGRTPAHAEGDVDLVARDVMGTFTLPRSYHYGRPPLVVGVEPSFGVEPGGDTVTVSGYGLDQAVGVRFGAASATGLNLLDNQTLRVVTPAGKNTVNVIMDGTNGRTDTLPNGFTFWPRVMLDSVRPPLGPAGRTVQLKGNGFKPGIKVFFGGVPATGVVVTNLTTVRVTVPPGTGRVDVVVSNPVSTATLPLAYEYN